MPRFYTAEAIAASSRAQAIRRPKAILIWEELCRPFVGFNRFAALPEEQISEKIGRRILSGDKGMLVWWSIWRPC
jgi:hypothetical protein